MDDNQKKRPRARRVPDEFQTEKNVSNTQNGSQPLAAVSETKAAKTDVSAAPVHPEQPQPAPSGAVADKGAPDVMQHNAQPARQNKKSEKKPARPANRAPRPAQSVPRPAQNPKRTEQPVRTDQNQPRQDVRSKPTPDMAPASPSENEKTKLTSVQPKSRLKTPVRENPPAREEGDGAMSGIFKAIIYMTVVLLVSVVLAYAAIVIANDAFAFVKSDEAVEVVIPENATVADIADILGDADVIEYPLLFKLFASFKKETGTDENGNSVFIPGTYTISPMNNYMQLLSAFKKQYTRDVVWVTIPEGATVEDIISILVDEYGIASRKEFIYAINEYDYDFDFLADIDMANGRYYRLEGYLFPDTYQFYTDSSAETVIYRMLVNFRKKLSYIGKDNCSERLAELGMTLDQVVTLASMIEKEVKYAVDYENVSSVFHNRLADPANFPRLDSDATTAYAIRMETGTRPETLGTEELNFDNPYNTRKVGGFPPSAIGNPGYEALYCAFYPAKTNYYYFVADNSGYNLYARTRQAHEQNVAAVRKEAEQ